MAALLDGLGVRWYLFGAQAAILHGASRLSADIDVTAQIEPGALGPLIAALPGAGFTSRVHDLVEFARETRVVPLVDSASDILVDLVLAGAGPEQEFLERAKMMKASDLRLPVISAEDLIVTKILAGRPKDLEDVAAVLRHYGKDLQLESARRLLGQIGAALDRSDLVSTLDRVAGEAGPRKARPKRGRQRT